jgi:hypothetical protein
MGFCMCRQVSRWACSEMRFRGAIVASTSANLLKRMRTRVRVPRNRVHDKGTMVGSTIRLLTEACSDIIGLRFKVSMRDTLKSGQNIMAES